MATASKRPESNPEPEKARSERSGERRVLGPRPAALLALFPPGQLFTDKLIRERARTELRLTPRQINNRLRTLIYRGEISPAAPDVVEGAVWRRSPDGRAGLETLGTASIAVLGLVQPGEYINRAAIQSARPGMSKRQVGQCLRQLTEKGAFVPIALDVPGGWRYRRML